MESGRNGVIVRRQPLLRQQAKRVGSASEKILMGEPWTDHTRKVLQEGKMYINTLELLTTERLEIAIIQNRILPPEVKTVVIRWTMSMPAIELEWAGNYTRL